MSTLAEDVGASLRLLRARDGYAAAVRALQASVAWVARGAAPDPASLDQLYEGLDRLDDLPDALRRLAWLRTFGAPAVSRHEHAWLTEAAWHCGVSRGAGGIADPTGAAALIVLLAAVPDGERAALMRSLRAHEAFEALYAHGASASRIAADAMLVALRVGAHAAALEPLLEDGREPTSPPEEIAAALARWLHDLATPTARRGPPSAAATEELLRAPWARGFRRRAVRQLGYAMGTAAQGIDLPPTLLGPTPEIQLALAPLLVEWLVALLAGLDPHGDATSRTTRLSALAPALPDRLRALVPEESPSGDALRLVLNPAEPVGIGRVWR